MGDGRACTLPRETIILTHSSLTYTVRSLCHCLHIRDEEVEVDGPWPCPALGLHALRVFRVGMEGRGL